MSRWTFNDVAVERVLEFEMPLIAPEILLPDATPEAIAADLDWLTPQLLDPATGHLVMAFHSLVVKTERHTIVVDTCGGNDKPRPGKPRYDRKHWPYLDALAKAGVQPEAVDYVLCTHLHVDHVGWNTRLENGRWVPTFPNAKYLFGRTEYDFWQAEWRAPDFPDDPFGEDSVLPVIEAGLAQFIEDDFAFDDAVTLEPTPGHTPGHLCLHVGGGNKGGGDAVLSGDLMHHALQCAHPDWNSIFCVDPAQSRATRRRFLERYADTGTLIMPAHFPTPTAGRVESAKDGFRFAFVNGD
ncbi:MAG TPA: MBL fold metallo-hydrolase [Alphaproteobacteria bacterium]|nr:MBL fold metallo-hydrolase [Alphaproteobacteria bacterium]